jgi:DNA processing protein
MAHQFGIDTGADAKWLALSNGVCTGARWLDGLLQRFNSPDALLGCSADEARMLGAQSLQRDIASARVPASLQRLIQEAPLHLITARDPEYPPLLAECEDRPPFLLVHGELEVLRADTLSVVGTRKPSLDGMRAATEFTSVATRAGRAVVSGLALGIDGLAHQSAIAAGGKTIAVLPSGLDRLYPARHRYLANKIKRNGALVSEFPMGTPPRKHHFYRRNRTLSGFSAATLVIEAGRPSGTLLTASAAADQGRDVLALPWSVYHPEGAGCRFLLDDGAMLISSIGALYEYLGCPQLGVTPGDLLSAAQTDAALDPDQKAILALTRCRPVPPEILAAYLGWDLERCLAGLSSLEVSGRLQRTGSGYQATPQRPD